MVLGSTAQTPTPDNFVATNDGNITADFLVRGDNTADWTLAGAAADETYIHRASPDAFSTTKVLTTTNQGLHTGVAASGTVTVSLKVGLPTSSAATAEQIAPVIVVAVIQ